jgi:hypothetical protein
MFGPAFCVVDRLSLAADWICNAALPTRARFRL